MTCRTNAKDVEKIEGYKTLAIFKFDASSYWQARFMNGGKCLRKTMRTEDRALAIEAAKLWYDTTPKLPTPKRKRPSIIVETKKDGTVKLKDRHTYTQMFRVIQNDLCAVCQNKFGDRNINLDHDHTTNEIRGLLCRDCNLLLGFARDSPEILIRATKYLLDYGKKLIPQTEIKNNDSTVMEDDPV